VYACNCRPVEQMYIKFDITQFFIVEKLLDFFSFGGNVTNITKTIYIYIYMKTHMKFWGLRGSDVTLLGI